MTLMISITGYFPLFQTRVHTQNWMAILGKCKRIKLKSCARRQNFWKCKKYVRFLNRNKIECEIEWGIYELNLRFVRFNSKLANASSTHDFGTERNFGIWKIERSRKVVSVGGAAN